jgi:hypothetical protein
MEIPFERSFASHEKAKYWSNKNEIKPNKVALKSYDKYWFICTICNHEIFMSLNHIVKGSWCGYCSIPQKKLCDNNNCNFCFERSFASHEKSVYLTDKSINTRSIFKSSHSRLLEIDYRCLACKIRINGTNQGFYFPSHGGDTYNSNHFQDWQSIQIDGSTFALCGKYLATIYFISAMGVTERQSFTSEVIGEIICQGRLCILAPTFSIMAVPKRQTILVR